MASIPEQSEPTLDVRGQIAHIDRLIVEAGKTRQDTRLAPWSINVTALGAAPFAAGAAFTKLVIG